jgi:hypothetical protein
MAQHHEVQAWQQALVEPEVIVLGQLLDIGERVAITDDFKRGPAVGIERLFVLN